MPEPSRSSLEIRTAATLGGTLIRMVGVIDETFAQDKIAPLSKVVVLDLDGVQRITSYGVREWIRAVSSLKSRHCYFVRCRPAIVSQFNMVSNFAGRGALVTFYAPFVCAACSRDIDVPIDLRRQHAMLSASRLPDVACPSCNGKAELDDMPEAYFRYAASSPAPAVHPTGDAIVNAVLGGAGAGGAAPRLEVVKEIDRQLTALWLSGTLDANARLKRTADGLEGLIVVVMAGVSSATPEGAAQFKTLTALGDANVSLARVPLHIATTLARTPPGLGNARLVSLSLHLQCESCTIDVETAVDVTLLARLSDAQEGVACPRCRGKLRADAAVVREALSLPLVEPPPEILGYLQSHVTAGDDTTSVGCSITGRRRNPNSSASSGSAPLSLSLPVWLGRYQLLRRVGTGGMGSVYLGRIVGAAGFERRVAIKMMHENIAADPECVAMFLDEARLAAQIHHPNVVSTLDVEETEQATFLVMEYVDGLSLYRLLAGLRDAGEHLPVGFTMRIALDLLAGLHAAHELRAQDGKSIGLVHRDVSPQNVLVGVDGVTRITDFGIAVAESRLASTKVGQIKGKIAYMAPEQLFGEQVDRRADVYGTAVVLWELLAGERLYAGESDESTFIKAIAGATSSPCTRNPAVPAAVGEVCLFALHLKPQERYQTAAAFAEALEKACEATATRVASTTALADMVTSKTAKPLTGSGVH